MTLGKAARVVLLAEAFAVTTFGLGWWTVPIVALVYAFVSHNENRARIAALCAVAGWATLLLLDFTKGPVNVMAEKLGGVMGIPGVVLLLVTLIFPGLLAWCAAKLTYLRASGPQASSS